MAENDNFLIAEILYNLREKYYNNATQVINRGLKTYGNDAVLKYYQSIALILQDRIHEAVRDLEFLKTRDDVGVGTLLALIHAHKKFSTIDRETIVDLDSKVKDARKHADEKSLVYGGYFWYIINRTDKAREYVDRSIKMNDQYSPGLALKGWMEIANDPKGALTFFEKSLSCNPKHTDSMLGLAKCKEAMSAYTQALDVVNRILVTNSNYKCGVIEKMKLQLCIQEWDQCLEVAQRALLIDSSCLEALRFQILELLCREGRYDDASEGINNLFQLLERNEPNSHYIYYDYAKVFARVCGKNTSILARTEQYIEKAIQLDQSNSNYLVELGFQKAAQNKMAEAEKCYKSALNLEENNINALLGKLHCQIAQDQVTEAAQQMDFLTEVQGNLNMNAEFPYLKAILAKKRNSLDKTSKLIDEAISCHFKGLKGLPLGTEYFFNLNPDFILELVKENLLFAPSSPIEVGHTPDPIFKKCSQILEALTKAVPGLIPGLFYLGKIKYLCGEYDSSKNALQKILDKNPSHADTHILMAQINLKQNDYKSASQSLEFGLSYNFQIKNHPAYHLIKAKIQKQQGLYQDALKTLQLAMQLPGVKKTMKSSNTEISMQDRALVFLELADTYLLNNLQHEATKIMQEAINEFKDTPEETRIAIANVDLTLNRGDIDGALNMLKRIDQNQPYYIQAREKIAQIYLKYRKDKKLYLATYKELADKYQNPHTLIILGDAYMNIVEPEKAVEVYENALRKNPKDSALAKKIGQALVKSHSYGKAINYYEAALKSGVQKLLRYDLAQLFFKLNQLDKAEKQCQHAISDDATDLPTMVMIGKCLYLMCEITQKQNNYDATTEWFEKAKEMYLKILKRSNIEDPDSSDEYKQMLMTIFKKFSAHFNDLKMSESVERILREAMQVDDKDIEIQVLLAEHYLNTENLDMCQQLCSHMLKSINDPSENVLLMLANLMFRRGDIEQSIYHFKKLFDKKPDHYEALVSLIKLFYRTGKIDDSRQFIEKIEKEIPKSVHEPGLNYAKGLFAQLSFKPTDALKYYNKCRGDKKFGRLAVLEMVDVCLNPDNEIRCDEDWKKKSTNTKFDASKIAQETAIKLLQSIGDRPNDVKFKVLENYCLMHSGEKIHLEKALENFIALEAQFKDSIAVLKGIAECYMLLKQPPKARNHLKRISKAQWTLDDADDLEKCWLLLAATYMAAGKFDQGLELCKKCIDSNKSCTKAYEFIGQMMEREAAYKDASDNYEKAWLYGKKNQPSIGYKLAFNYIKAKRYTDAIDVSHYIIEKFPDFPKIKKEVLEKARQLIKT